MNTSSKPPKRAPAPSRKTLDERVGRVDVLIREMAAQTVVTSQIVANHFGLHTTDLRVLDIIYMRKKVLAGELVKATGLTSGSVTALVDRLVKAGYVERRDDATDRRKVWVCSRHDAIEPIKEMFMPSQARMYELWRTFTAEELETIASFLERTTALAAECAEEMRRGNKSTGTQPTHRSKEKAS
ncbi:MarR family winged helix-turn-helix transcriptional regulator [Dyella flagellata]|nr:MarR family transcriptional regulator [Dyella flagellata]